MADVVGAAFHLPWVLISSLPQLSLSDTVAGAVVAASAMDASGVVDIAASAGKRHLSWRHVLSTASISWS